MRELLALIAGLAGLTLAIALLYPMKPKGRAADVCSQSQTGSEEDQSSDDEMAA